MSVREGCESLKPLTMCGISGKVSWDGPLDCSLVKRMMNAMIHRGPDDEGIYVEPQAILGHRRLAIIDLDTGRQPISNEDQTIWIVFNGEIYNFAPLRDELIRLGHRFQTQSDTEVIVHLYEEFGERCLNRLHGMFAFAIWDVRNKRLFLARDRVGIKPLYYSLNGKSITFASEVRALLCDSDVNREPMARAIDQFLTFQYMPGSETIFSGVKKLLPGHYLVCEHGKVKICEYWDLSFASNARNVSIADATSRLTDLLQQTVRDHLISDVPIGVLLSGGVDSTGLLSLCVQESKTRIKTFTVGFDGEAFADERTFARLGSSRYGTEHYEMTISSDDFRACLPTYVRHMEEPVCEPPAIALFYVTQLASRHVKVLISGEGGDEAFAGYQNYRNLVWLERLKRLKQPWFGLAEMLMGGLSTMNPSRFDKYMQKMKVPLEQFYYGRSATPQSPLMRLKADLYASDFLKKIDPLYSLEYLRQCFAKVENMPPLNKMLYVDTKTWLPDDLLLKADKMTMANSVELRVPLLDHNILEFAAGLPAECKLKGFTTKYILKKALRERLPKQILNRKKAGFPVPLQSWISGKLFGYSRDVLLDRRSVERGYFNKSAVESLLKAAKDQRNYGKEIFSLIVLELWHREFVDV